MKKIIIALACVLAVSTNLAFGQLHLKVGPKIGYNASILSTSIDEVSSQFKSGFQLGVFVRLGTKMYLQPEVYYTTQGGVFEGPASSWKQTITLGSLDVPLLAGISFFNTDMLNVRIHAGPVASFIVNRKIEDEGTVGPVKESDIKNINWYLQAGAGIDVWKFTLDIRYQLGLNKIISDVTIQNQTVDFNTSNNVWVVSLGFKFL
jgi:hypothetical protein